jgi:hypothetical protein
MATPVGLMPRRGAGSISTVFGIGLGYDSFIGTPPDLRALRLGLHLRRGRPRRRLLVRG